MNRAGSAQGATASELCTRKMQIVSQRPKQRSVRIGLYLPRLTVDIEGDHHGALVIVNKSFAGRNLSLCDRAASRKWHARAAPASTPHHETRNAPGGLANYAARNIASTALAINAECRIASRESPMSLWATCPSIMATSAAEPARATSPMNKPRRFLMI